MSRTDLTSDAFTIIRNAIGIKADETVIPYSKMMLSICAILKKEGYIEKFKEIEAGSFKQIKVYLRYYVKKSVINVIKKISTPGRRVYLSAKDINSVLRGYGLAIVSTSSGLFTDREARAKGLGGEVLGMVW